MGREARVKRMRNMPDADNSIVYADAEALKWAVAVQKRAEAIGLHIPRHIAPEALRLVHEG